MSFENLRQSSLRSGADSEELLSSLSQKCAYPNPADRVEVRQTHISLVFLAGDFVYKVKKNVRLPFLDFSTVDRRRHFCLEEVRVNSPWAPGVYLGVVPIVRTNEGLRVEAAGEPVEWAVKMRRLKEDTTVRSYLNEGTLTPRVLWQVAQRIAAVHGNAPRVTPSEAARSVETLRRLWNENWEFAARLPTEILDKNVMQRLQQLSVSWLDRCEADLRFRAAHGMVREVHGDLRLEHIFLSAELSDPDGTHCQSPSTDAEPAEAPFDMIVLDGIEFDADLRNTDVLGDVAFVAMELAFCGRRDLMQQFLNGYDEASGQLSFGQTACGELLTLFMVYRSAVRAKVAAIAADESEVPPTDRERAVARSRAHWLWCLSELESPERRPALLLISGLPGTGKSTLAKAIAERTSFDILRSDVVRHEIFGNNLPESSTPRYSPDSTQRVYQECWQRARAILLQGGRVIVDATFQRDDDRNMFLQLAVDCGVRSAWLECMASPEAARKRIEARHGDASEADWAVHQLIRSRWEPPGALSKRSHHVINTGDTLEMALSETMRVLESVSLMRETEAIL